MKRSLALGFAHKLFGLLLLISPSAHAERPPSGNPYQWIASGGDVGFSDSGAAFLPQSVLSGLGENRISPMMQFVLYNHIMSSCIEDVVKDHPGMRESFVSSFKKFKDGLCRIQNCFQQTMMISLLPELKKANGGGQGSQEQAMAFAAAFQKSDCDGDGKGGQLDPMILMLITKGKGGAVGDSSVSEK